MFCNLTDLRGTLQPVCQFIIGVFNLWPNFLYAPWHMHAPGLVPEITLDFTNHRRHQECLESAIEGCIKPVDCTEQTDHPDLHKVFVMAFPFRISVRKRLYQLLIVLHESRLGFLVPFFLMAAYQCIDIIRCESFID